MPTRSRSTKSGASLPQNLRAFLSLEGEAAVVGVGKYFEIWTPADWAKKMEMLHDAEANAQRFAALNL
jgi:DNA-binding transcriptional regulator/RsmH inhibitor MraZ